MSKELIGKTVSIELNYADQKDWHGQPGEIETHQFLEVLEINHPTITVKDESGKIRIYNMSFPHFVNLVEKERITVTINSGDSEDIHF